MLIWCCDHPEGSSLSVIGVIFPDGVYPNQKKKPAPSDGWRFYVVRNSTWRLTREENACGWCCLYLVNVCSRNFADRDCMNGVKLIHYFCHREKVDLV